MTTFTCSVTVPRPLSNETETLKFVIRAHLSRSPDQRLLPPEFYRPRPDGGVPHGDHYELEIIQPEASQYGNCGIIHYRSVPEIAKYFICYLPDVPTLEAAEGVIRIWCVGAAFTKFMRADFMFAYEENPDTFLDNMNAMGISAEVTRT